jgi:uncharacterized membrane protein
MKSQLSLYSFIALYAVGGIMHFIFPEPYLEVIPDWLGDKMTMNYLAGAVELLIALLAIFSKTRKFAGIITILMLGAFTISHIYFIQNGSCISSFCIPKWISWLRLFIIHPILMYWAWKISRL